MSATLRSREIIQVGVWMLLFATAPTVGNIGSCGQDPVDLDPEKFFTAKEGVDCRRCTECGLSTKPCARACDGEVEPVQFPPGCYPLVHDGEVCLDALNAASCGDYEEYMADIGPTIATECNFCPPRGDGAGGAAGAGQGGSPPGVGGGVGGP